MNDRELTEKFGVSRSYFSSIRKMSPEKHDFIFGFDTDREKSLMLYVEYVESIVSDIKSILARYKPYKKEYGQILVDLGLSEATSLRHCWYHDEKIVKKVKEPKSYLTINFQTIQRFQLTINSIKDK